MGAVPGLPSTSNLISRKCCIKFAFYPCANKYSTTLLIWSPTGYIRSPLNKKWQTELCSGQNKVAITHVMRWQRLFHNNKNMHAKITYTTDSCSLAYHFLSILLIQFKSFCCLFKCLWVRKYIIRWEYLLCTLCGSPSFVLGKGEEESNWNRGWKLGDRNWGGTCRNLGAGWDFGTEFQWNTSSTWTWNCAIYSQPSQFLFHFVFCFCFLILANLPWDNI